MKFQVHINRIQETTMEIEAPDADEALYQARNKLEESPAFEPDSLDWYAQTEYGYSVVDDDGNVLAEHQ